MEIPLSKTVSVKWWGKFMGILIDENVHIMVQGGCTSRGWDAIENMLNYNTDVVASICYDFKKLDTYRGVNTFNSVEEAVREYPEINTSVIAVHSLHVLGAVLEAIEAGIKLIVILTGYVPIKDISILYHEAKGAGVRILGPNSVGIINPEVGMVGNINGAMAWTIYRKGSIGVISRSNGLINEIGYILSNNDLGVSTAVAMGTEKMVLSSFKDILPYFWNDTETEAVVIFGEPGTGYEEELAEFVKTTGLKKPIVAYIAGKFVDKIKGDISLGHLGAIVQRGKGTPSEKLKLLKECGIKVVNFLEDLPGVLKNG
jgi:succinyl-CoA synthetase alpha subunit